MKGNLTRRIAATVTILRVRRVRRLARMLTERRIQARYDRVLRDKLRTVERLREEA
jgi:hypothetical protein